MPEKLSGFTGADYGVIQKTHTPEPDAPMKEQMAHRMKTAEGKALYKLRKQTVEPVFGIIKEAMGFRRFSMRGKEKAETEWQLVCLSYNLRKMFNLLQGCAHGVTV